MNDAQSEGLPSDTRYRLHKQDIGVGKGYVHICSWLLDSEAACFASLHDFSSGLELLLDLGDSLLLSLELGLLCGFDLGDHLLERINVIDL